MAPTRYLAALALVLVVLAIGAEAGADMSDCKVAQMQFSDCVTYVLGAGADKKVSQQCCIGLEAIIETVRTDPELRSLCACLLSEMVGAKGNLTLAADIPTVCGHHSVPFLPTSPDFDCSRIPLMK